VWAKAPKLRAPPCRLRQRNSSFNKFEERRGVRAGRVSSYDDGLVQCVEPAPIPRGDAVYSCRNVAARSVRRASNAGVMHASSAVIARMTDAPANASGSSGVTP
jgi:hypothetical protein